MSFENWKAFGVWRVRSILITFALVVLLGVAPAFAKTTQYACKFAQDRRGGGLVPEVAFVFVDQGTGTFAV